MILKNITEVKGIFSNTGKIVAYKAGMRIRCESCKRPICSIFESSHSQESKIVDHYKLKH